MRIVIDLQGAQTDSRFRGIGRYSLAISKAIAALKAHHEVLIVLNASFPETIEPIRKEFADLLPYENIRVFDSLYPTRESQPENKWRRSAAAIIREAFINDLNPDVLYITSFFEGFIDDAVITLGSGQHSYPIVVTLYDLTPLLNPTKYLTDKNYKKFYLTKLDEITKADGFFAISEHSAAEAIKHLEIEIEKITNISGASDNIFKINKDNDTDRLKILGIHKPYVLYSDGGDQRKNLIRLVQSFACLSDQIMNKFMLVFAGYILEDEKRKLIKEAELSKLPLDQIVFTEYLPEEDLAFLYNNCALFVLPSWHEGFGLPALEAIRCGAPVIASNTSSLPEVVCTEETLFDPFNTDDITQKMESLLSNESYRNEIAKKQYEHSLIFSWENSARTAINFFEKFSVKDKNTAFVSDVSNLVSRIAGIDASFNDWDLKFAAKAISINHPSVRKKQLFVDISELIQTDARTGIQRVTRSILNELTSNPPTDYEVVPVYGMIEKTGYMYADPLTNNVKGCCNNNDTDIIEFKVGDIFLGLDLQHHVTRCQNDFLKFMYQMGVKIYFVVYDLIPILLPHCYPAKHSVDTVHTQWLSVISQFNGAVCISKSVSDELSNWLAKNISDRLDFFDISWFHLGADIDNSLPSLGIPEDSIKVFSAIKDRISFLMVGTLEPRKGHHLVLDAFDLVWNSGSNANLILIGKKGWLTDDLCDRIRKHREYGKRLFWLEGISDEYLEKVYAASTCLIAASEGEGFGLPLIEAAQKKIPIIARDIPVFREVAGKHAFYFSASTGNELAGSIKEWLTLYNEDRHPKSDDMPWLTWKESTKQLLKAIGIENEGSGSDNE